MANQHPDTDHNNSVRNGLNLGKSYDDLGDVYELIGPLATPARTLATGPREPVTHPPKKP